MGGKKKDWIDISNMDALIVIAVAVIWFVLLWLAGNLFALKA